MTQFLIFPEQNRILQEKNDATNICDILLFVNPYIILTSHRNSLFSFWNNLNGKSLHP